MMAAAAGAAAGGAAAGRVRTSALGSVFCGQTVPDPMGLLSVDTLVYDFLYCTTQVLHDRPVGVNIGGRKFELRPRGDLSASRILAEAASVTQVGCISGSRLPQYVSDGVAVIQHVSDPARRAAEIAITVPPPLTHAQLAQMAVAHFWVACARYINIDDDIITAAAEGRNADDDDTSDGSGVGDSSGDTSEDDSNDDDDGRPRGAKRTAPRKLQRAIVERAQFAVAVACAYAAVGWSCDWFDAHKNQSLFAVAAKKGRRHK